MEHDDPSTGPAVVIRTLAPGDDRIAVGALVQRGYFALPGCPHEAATFRYFAVDPAVQGRRVGESMVRWVIDRARADGKRRVRIHTLEMMRGARRLYERLGFVRDPQLDEDWNGVVGLAYRLDV